MVERAGEAVCRLGLAIVGNVQRTLLDEVADALVVVKARGGE